MKKWFSRKSNILFAILLALVIWKQLPLLINNLTTEGVKLNTGKYSVLSVKDELSVVEFPPPHSKVITIFWATWCGPCKIEMQRLRSSINEDKISASKVYAINPFEPASTVRSFLETNNYPFIFLEAPQVTQRLNIQATPTTLFIDKGEITSISSGMSLIGIWKAERFLQ